MPKVTIKHINIGLVFLTAFVIPIYQPLVRYLIGLLALSTFFNLKKESGSFLGVIPLLSYFIWLLIGLLWTENMTSGWKEIEYSLSFLLFPLIFWFANVNLKEMISRILSFFTFGYIISMIICMLLAISSYLANGDLKAFYYADLSYFHHPSYMALYGNTSLIYLYFSLINANQIKTFYFKSGLSKFALISVISIFVLLLMSKAGILTMLLINIIGILVVFKSRNKLKQAFSIIIGLLLIISGAYITIKPLQNRVNEAWTSLTTEKPTESSTGARMLVWESSWEIIKTHPLSGVGTGDLSDELDNIYSEKKYEKLLKKSLNAHNQFLESWAKNGLLGIISLLLLFLYAFRNQRNQIYLYFTILVFVNLLMESMMQIQSGIVFIAFMNSLFAISIIRKTAC